MYIWVSWLFHCYSLFAVLTNLHLNNLFKLSTFLCVHVLQNKVMDKVLYIINACLKYVPDLYNDEGTGIALFGFY